MKKYNLNLCKTKINQRAYQNSFKNWMIQLTIIKNPNIFKQKVNFIIGLPIYKYKTNLFKQQKKIMLIAIKLMLKKERLKNLDMKACYNYQINILILFHQNILNMTA